MKFHDREAEMAELERVFSLCKKGSHLTVLSGRRRIGKTRLVEEFIRGKDAVYLFVSRKGSKLLLEEFSELLRARSTPTPLFTRWDDLFEHLFTIGDRSPVVVVFDEFQNFAHVDGGIFSVLQKVYDANRPRKGLHLMVTGSHATLMNRIFRESREPLFGRATEHISLPPLPSKAVFSMCRELGFKSIGDIVQLYAMFGGIPKYYCVLDEQGLGGNTLAGILSSGFFCDFPLFKDEVQLVLSQDLGASYYVHFSILQAVAEGYNTLSGIADKTGIKRDSLSKYLQILRDELGILEYRTPVTMDRAKSKMGRYRIGDNISELTFCIVNRQRSLVEGGRHEEALQNALGTLPEFVSGRFEELVRDLVRENLPYTEVGSWWNRKGDEVDIVAVSEKDGTILFGEVKWRSRPVGWKVVEELKAKAPLVPWREGERRERYLLVSKGGFTESCLRAMDAEGVLHWDLDEIDRMTRG